MLAGERGSMFIEVLVSAVLLIVISLATLAVIDRAGEASGMNRARSVSTALAQSDQDYVRQLPWSQVSSIIGSSTPLGTEIPVPDRTTAADVDGRIYQVHTTLSIVKDDNVRTACLAGWENKRVRVRTQVDAPAGHKMKPVTMETYRVPSIADKPNMGSVIVRLSRANGSPTAGIPVAVTGMDSKETDADGCAVFNDVPTGSNKIVAWGTDGGDFVDENGADQVKRVLTISPGSTAQLAGRFDTATSLDFDFKDEDGNAGAWDSVSVVNSGISTVYNGVREWKPQVQFSSREIGPMFPFLSSYGVFAGDCWGNNPDIWGGANLGSNNSVLLTTDQADVAVLMPKVSVKLNPAPTGTEEFRVFLAYERRVRKMGTGRCDITDGILPNGPGDPPIDPKFVSAPYKVIGSATPNAAVSYPMPYGTFTLCIDRVAGAGAPKRLSGSKAVRIDNVPGGAGADPFYNRTRFPTVNKADISEDGRCSQDASEWPRLSDADTNPVN